MKRWSWIVSIFVLAHAPADAASCDQSCLRTHVDRYMNALIARDASSLKLAKHVRFTENGKPSKIGEGLWSSASALGRYKYVAVDPATQEAMYIGIVNEGAAPTIATVRLKVADEGVVEIEHVVARNGSHALFAPEALVKPHPSLTTQVKQRLSREKLIEIADTYFEGIEQHTSKIILSSPTCQRIENGVQTTNQPGRTSKHCAESADVLTYIKSVDDRRYPIVDVTNGIVISTILFDIEGETNEANAARISADPTIVARLRQPRTLLLTEWFKIDDGKIQHIEAIMHNLPRGSKSGWER